MLIRAAGAADHDFLERMLLAAFRWRPTARPLLPEDPEAIEALADPALAHYVTGWPRPGEIGVVAVDDSTAGIPSDGPSNGAAEPDPEADARLGAAWLRYLSADDPGYGYVADDVPELGMAVRHDARARGIGRALMTALVDAAREAGIERVSLSVEDGNFARRLYDSVGFVPVWRNGGSDTMLLTLS